MPNHFEEGEVHVWRAGLETSIEQLDEYSRLLSQDELARAARFKFERDQKRFLVARGVLRKLLAHYTGRSASEIEILTQDHGKPYLGASFEVHFNVSHSANQAAYAFARTPVGVDIEAVRPLDDIEQIARHFFSPAEINSLKRYQAQEQVAAFFRCWARKEAFIKQTGLGLSQGLDSFSVSLEASDPKLLYVKDHNEPQTRWTLSNIQTEPGFAGALVAEAPLTRVTEMVY